MAFLFYYFQEQESSRQLTSPPGLLSTPVNVTNSVPHAAVHQESENTGMPQFAKYMLCRELTKTGLAKFDNKPATEAGNPPSKPQSVN